MEKINFYKPKNQFPQAEIRFPLAGMKNLLTKCFPWEKLFSLPGISDK